MKVSRLETAGKRETINLRSLGIQTWGDFNDHPQRLMEIGAGSITGNACLKTYAKFVEGRGFRDSAFAAAIVNRSGETANDLLHKIAADFATFGGYALHCNWNALGEVTEVSHIPFEWLRFAALDNDGHFDRLAMHPDWGLRFTRLRPFRRNDIRWFDFYDPSKVKEQAARDGWNDYNGQILYFSNCGRKTYPEAAYSPAVTDMSSEEGLSNITYRNARHNFLPAGMLIDHNNNIESEEQERETREEVKAFQGDTNAGKLLYINLQGGDQAPEFKPFTATNTDTSYREANNNVPDRIGRAFCQPPILRAEDVGSNFGATAMREAYDFYNSQTETERLALSRTFADIFGHFAFAANESGDYGIEPKQYAVTQTLAERLGADTSKVLEIVSGDMETERKRAILQVVYGLKDEDIDRLLQP